MGSFSTGGSVRCGIFCRRWPSESGVLSLSPGFSSL